MKRWLIERWHGVLDNLLATGAVALIAGLGFMAFFKGLHTWVMNFLGMAVPIGAVMVTVLVVSCGIWALRKWGRPRICLTSEETPRADHILEQELEQMAGKEKKLRETITRHERYIAQLRTRMQAAGLVVPDPPPEAPGSVLRPRGR